MIIHVVRSGDTLWRIANKYSVGMEQIKLVNHLQNPDVLVIGQALVVPEPAFEYVVEPGDTLWEISQQYNVPMNELSEHNNITTPSRLFVGDLLEIPYQIYRVQSGETLWMIANRFNTTVARLVQINQITNPSMIYPGQELRVPMRSKPLTEVNGYITDTDESGRLEVLMVGRHLTYLSPFTYTFGEDGSLSSFNEEPVLEASAETNTAPLLVLTNFDGDEFSSDLVATLLRNSEIQDELLDNMIELMGEKGYLGVNFDFEYVYPEDRERYNHFLRKAVERLHAENYIVSTALAPKDTGDQSGLLYEAHDYAAHGEIVDFVILMTYEWGWAGGRPWAVAPINEVREVLDYAVTVIPREKILMGVPLYGRRWKIPWQEGTTATTISPYEAVQLAARYGVEIKYHELYQTPYFQYTDEAGQRYEVWFEDARSIQAKYETIKEYGLRGASFWALGIPFPQNWPVLQNEFRVKKL